MSGSCKNHGHAYYDGVCADCGFTSDEEVDELEARIRELENQIRELKAENERLKAQLQDIAAEADEWSDDYHSALDCAAAIDAILAEKEPPTLNPTGWLRCVKHETIYPTNGFCKKCRKQSE